MLIKQQVNVGDRIDGVVPDDCGSVAKLGRCRKDLLLTRVKLRPPAGDENPVLWGNMHVATWQTGPECVSRNTDGAKPGLGQQLLR